VGTSSATKPPPGSLLDPQTAQTSDGTKAGSLTGPLSESPSELTDLKVDDIVVKWTEEIEELVEEFRKQAIQVGRWDRQIIANEDKIVALHKESQALRVSHKELEMNLDAVLAQQSDLSRVLDTLEAEIAQAFGEKIIPGVVGSGMSPADMDRQRMHQQTNALSKDLDAVSSMLREIIDKINDSKKLSDGDILGQIVTVLNAHLTSLQYLDERSTNIQHKLSELGRVSDIIRRETNILHTRNEY